jgi:hypothetical protein
MSTAKYAPLAVMLCACGGGDAAPRDAPPDVDNGSCGSMLRFTGEYVDWTSSSAAFCGILGPTFTVQATGVMVKPNAPNGRFDLCVPDAATSLVDITPPTDPSPCNPAAGTYMLPAIAVANKAVRNAGGAWSGRAFGVNQQVVNQAKAQVFVHVNGSPTQVAIAADHGPSQALVNDTWVPGDTANDVFFPDVDPTSGSTNLTPASAIGAGSIPLVAGKMTNVSIIVP